MGKIWLSAQAFLPYVLPYVKTYNFESYSQIWFGGENVPPLQITTQTTHWDHSPMLSPNGSQIAFIRLDLATIFVEQLVVINSDGSGENIIDSNSTYNCSAPMWHPNGTKILYNVDPTGAGNNTFYEIEPDGSNKTSVFSDASIFRPTYNSDGSMIGYLKAVGGGLPEQLRVVNSDGSSDHLTRTLSETALNAVVLGWANTMNRIAFNGVAAGLNDVLARIDEDGTDYLELTAAASDPDRPIPGRFTWSPDDATIFMARGGGAPWGLWSVSPDGSNLTNLNVNIDADDGNWPHVIGARIYLVKDGAPDTLVSVDYSGGDQQVLDDGSDGGAIEMMFDSGL
jgi:WD40-like Beta Propeller Repeat